MVSHAQPLDVQLLCLGNTVPSAIEALIESAKNCWLRNEQVLDLLKNYKNYGFKVSVRSPQRPEGGSLFLFNRNAVRYFRKDGHEWRKKFDGKTVRETHEKLKVNGEVMLNCYYAHSVDNDLQRRSYWLLDNDKGLVLVHYLATTSTRRSRYQMKKEVMMRLQECGSDECSGSDSGEPVTETLTVSPEKRPKREPIMSPTAPVLVLDDHRHVIPNPLPIIPLAAPLAIPSSYQIHRQRSVHKDWTPPAGSNGLHEALLSDSPIPLLVHPPAELVWEKAPLPLFRVPTPYRPGQSTDEASTQQQAQNQGPEPVCVDEAEAEGPKKVVATNGVGATSNRANQAGSGKKRKAETVGAEVLSISGDEAEGAAQVGQARPVSRPDKAVASTDKTVLHLRPSAAQSTAAQQAENSGRNVSGSSAPHSTKQHSTATNARPTITIPKAELNLSESPVPLAQPSIAYTHPSAYGLPQAGPLSLAQPTLVDQSGRPVAFIQVIDPGSAMHMQPGAGNQGARVVLLSQPGAGANGMFVAPTTGTVGGNYVLTTSPTAIPGAGGMLLTSPAAGAGGSVLYAPSAAAAGAGGMLLAAPTGGGMYAYAPPGSTSAMLVAPQNGSAGSADGLYASSGPSTARSSNAGAYFAAANGVAQPKATYAASTGAVDGTLLSQAHGGAAVQFAQVGGQQVLMLPPGTQVTQAGPRMLVLHS